MLRRAAVRSRPLQRSLFSFASAKPVDIEAEVRKLHGDVLTPLNKRLLGPLERFSEQLTPLPMVFVLGNHSRCGCQHLCRPSHPTVAFVSHS
jgi:hypothetical protein